MINTIILAAFALIIVLLPALIAFGMSVKFGMLEEPGVKQRFGYLYESLNLNQGRTVILIPLLFLFRRFAICASVVYQKSLLV